MTQTSRPPRPLRPLDFFATHPVFRVEDFDGWQVQSRGRSHRTTAALLRHHVAVGRLFRVRRGLYASVPPGLAATDSLLDPFLVSSTIADDAVVAYHSALEFHGVAHSVFHRFTFLTATRIRPLRLGAMTFRPVLLPARLRTLPDRGGGISEVPHAGSVVRVTTPERTLVDVMTSPRHGGGWEEIWRSLEGFESLEAEEVVSYAIRAGNALAVARVGLFLEQHRETIDVSESQLASLREHTPRQPVYFDRRRRSAGSLVRAWNLIVPHEVLSRSWAEVA